MEVGIAAAVRMREQCREAAESASPSRTADVSSVAQESRVENRIEIAHEIGRKKQQAAGKAPAKAGRQRKVCLGAPGSSRRGRPQVRRGKEAAVFRL